ncbi:MAG: hypothetical protein KDA96_25765, partial [Planctomycetaceae bacterium]|nr:hypothetical protein [Planctomycetaceae bacterium]
ILIGVIALQMAETVVRLLVYLVRPIGAVMHRVGTIAGRQMGQWEIEKQQRRDRWKRQWQNLRTALREMKKK